MECVPLARAEVVKTACIPELVPLRLAVPKTVVPSINVTVPVGKATPAPTPVTVAVNVTDSPAVIESSEADNEAVVLNCCTVALPPRGLKPSDGRPYHPRPRCVRAGNSASTPLADLIHLLRHGGKTCQALRQTACVKPARTS